jgi:drug/metabolite transporter (DMT)-like permease
MREPVATAGRAGGGSTATAYLLLVVAMLSWAGNFIVARALADTVPPLGLSLMRWVVAFAAVIPFTARELASKRAVLVQRWRILVLLALLGLTIANSCSYVGLQSTTALNAALCNSAGPMLTLAASFAFYREPARPLQLVGILVSLLGVVVIVLRGDVSALLTLNANRGDLVVLLGVTSWAVYTVLLRRRPPELSPLALIAVLFAIGGATLLPLHLAEAMAGRPLSLAPAALAAYAYVGLFPAAVAFFCWNRGVAVIGPTPASLFAHLLPVFAAALAYVFLGERIGGFHLAGGALIFLGILLANRRSPR